MCKEGGIGLYFFVINDGDFGVSIGENTVATLHKGQSFGEIALLQGVPRNASVQVTSESGACWTVVGKG